MASMTIGELLKTKEVNVVWSVAPDAPVTDALQYMADKDIGAVMVIEDCKLVGILSERDYAREIVVRGQCALESPVSELMTKENLITVTPENTVEECMSLMTEHHFRHLPVVEKGCVTGVISIGDLVKAVITGQATIIDSLENYITGTEYGKV